MRIILVVVKFFILIIIASIIEALLGVTHIWWAAFLISFIVGCAGGPWAFGTREKQQP